MSNFITNAFASLFSHLTGLGSEAWDYIKENLVPILEKDASKTLSALAPIAESAVLQFAATGHVSNEKRDLAVAALKAGASAAGIDAANGLLNLAIETAYNKLSAQGKLPTVEPYTPETPSASA